MTTPRKTSWWLIAATVVTPLLLAAVIVTWPSGASKSNMDDYRSDLMRQCRADIACWGSRFRDDAQWPCQDAIERAAQFDYRWLNRFGEDRFPLWKAPRMAALSAEGYITYYGEALMLQNGYGAWSHNVYECDYLPGSGTAMSVRVHRGRLPSADSRNTTDTVLRDAESFLVARDEAASKTEK